MTFLLLPYKNISSQTEDKAKFRLDPIYTKYRRDAKTIMTDPGVAWTKYKINSRISEAHHYTAS